MADSRSRLPKGLPEKSVGRNEESSVGFFIIGAGQHPPISPPVDDSPYDLTSDSRPESQRDEVPTEAGLDSQIDDEWYGDMDVEIPAEGELIVVLPQVAERDVDKKAEEYEPCQGNHGMHERHSRVLAVVCQSLDSCLKYPVMVLFDGCEYSGHRIQ